MIREWRIVVFTGYFSCAGPASSWRGVVGGVDYFVIRRALVQALNWHIETRACKHTFSKRPVIISWLRRLTRIFRPYQIKTAANITSVEHAPKRAGRVVTFAVSGLCRCVLRRGWLTVVCWCNYFGQQDNSVSDVVRETLEESELDFMLMYREDGQSCALLLVSKNWFWCMHMCLCT